MVWYRPPVEERAAMWHRQAGSVRRAVVPPTASRPDRYTCRFDAANCGL